QDYHGQKLAEMIYCYLIVIFGARGGALRHIAAGAVIAWFFGYFAQDFTVTFGGWAVGLVIAMLLCVPDWPMFNRHP
ncbi:hypothetical protein AURANDRAFT_17929, partial [Aureococcus anophagefferens]